MCQMVLKFFFRHHVKTENFEHGTRRVDKLLFSMGNVFNSALVDIGQSQEFRFLAMRTKDLFEDC